MAFAGPAFRSELVGKPRRVLVNVMIWVAVHVAQKGGRWACYPMETPWFKLTGGTAPSCSDTITYAFTRTTDNRLTNRPPAGARKFAILVPLLRQR